MILVEDIRRGFQEEAALDFSFEGYIGVQLTEMWVRSTGRATRHSG